MCGIIGTIGISTDITAARFQKARDLMVHRGPDDAGVWTGEAVRLGARRLAILDLSPAGHQPMVSPDGQTVLVFNGEIYNYRQLRRELEDRCAFLSQTDTEVLLHGFTAWGWEELLRRIDGMFALAIWDAQNRKLYAARDRVGKKPFFYTCTSGTFLFASTLNALRALLPATPVIDPVALDAYLTYQAVPSPMSIFQGIRQLPPAHRLIFEGSTQRLTISRYWDIRYAPKLRLHQQEVLDELDNLVCQAVRRRLVSDVPLGAFLSGGVDSSLIVSMMAQEKNEPVEAVVVGFDDPRFDERPFARQVAALWGVHLHGHVLQPDAVTDLPEIIWQYGQPLGDVSIVPAYYVARAAKAHVTVVLNGDGGDEVFGGYARPMVARAARIYRRLLPAGLRRALGRGLANWDQKSLKKLKMLATAGQGTAMETFVYDQAFRRYRRQAYTDSFQSSIGDWHPDVLYRQVWERADGSDDVDRELYGDFSTSMADLLLAKSDVSTMAHSLEARSPFLDKTLIEFAARIPTAMRLQWYTTKYLLKRLAERYVPRRVLYRRKQGFVMPASEWLRGQLAPYVKAVLLDRSFRDRGWIRPEFVARMLDEHMAGRQDWREQLWTLFVLEIWMRLAVDSSLQRGDSLEGLRRKD